MPRIRSANQDFPLVETSDDGSFANVYVHGADTRKNYIPLAFQVTSPYNPGMVLLPHSLVAHINPSSISETLNKKVEKIQTRGGFVEQHWGDELGEISADMSTGAFLNINNGLSSVIRQRTIAWDRYRDLYDLYRNNGSVYDPFGNIVLQGNILLMYDRGTYIGYFKSFSVEETDDSPFAFKLSWSFKVEKTIYQVPQGTLRNRGGAGFQSDNRNKKLPSVGTDNLARGETQGDRLTRLGEAPGVTKDQQAAAAQKLVDTASAFGSLLSSGAKKAGGAVLASGGTGTGKAGIPTKSGA